MSEEWASHIGRTPDLLVNDTHYTWAGSGQLGYSKTQALQGSSRLVDVNLDRPETLSWAVTLQNPKPSASFDPTRFARIRVIAGVSRASVVAECDLLGAFTGQITAQSLRIELVPFPTVGPHNGENVCNFAAVVSRGNASQSAWPSNARLANIGDVGGDTLTRAASWRRGLTISRKDAVAGESVTVKIPQNADGSGRFIGQYEVAIGQTLTMGNYCGPFQVVTSGALTYAEAAIAEW